MLHSRLLRYLDEVVRSGSIRGAAEKLNVSSSSINRQILELEDGMQAPIFERLPRGLRLTAAGEVLIAHIRQTLRDHDRVTSRISELQGLSRSTIKIATMDGLAGGILANLVVDFRKRHPGVKVDIKIQVAEDILKSVEQADADIGLGYNLRADPGMHTLMKFDMRLGAILAPEHPLASKTGVRLLECREYPVVQADPTLSIYGLIKDACAASKVAFKPAFETNSIAMMKYLAVHDSAVVFLSATDVSEEMRSGQLKYLRILDRSLKTHSLSLVHRANSSLALAPALFAEAVRASASKLLDAL